MKVNEMFPGSFLKGQDLNGDVPKIMTTVTYVEFEGEKKPVLNFSDGSALVMNQTNANLIKELHGDETDHWQGKQITLYNDPNIMYMGQRKGGIRIRFQAGGDNGVAPAQQQDRPLNKMEASSLVNEWKGNGWSQEDAMRVISEVCGKPIEGLSQVNKSQVDDILQYLGRPYRADMVEGLDSSQIPF